VRLFRRTAVPLHTQRDAPTRRIMFEPGDRAMLRQYPF
jgi:hypothetical protein